MAVAGTIVTLTAIPFAGYKFDEWELCDQKTQTASGGICIITIQEGVTRYVRAEFKFI